MRRESEYPAGDICKYYNCKSCERSRHASARNKGRYATKEDGTTHFACQNCNTIFDWNDTYKRRTKGRIWRIDTLSWEKNYGDDERFLYYDCKKCGRESRMSKKKLPDLKTGLPYYAPLCYCGNCDKYGCVSNECHLPDNLKTVKKVFDPVLHAMVMPNPNAPIKPKEPRKIKPRPIKPKKAKKNDDSDKENFDPAVFDIILGDV